MTISAGGASLVDYAGTVAGPARSEIGDAEFNKYSPMLIQVIRNLAPNKQTFFGDVRVVGPNGRVVAIGSWKLLR